MRPHHCILDRNRVHRLAAEHLQGYLKFKDYKKKTSAQMLWSLLLAAAARITSLSDACQRLGNVPSELVSQARKTTTTRESYSPLKSWVKIAPRRSLSERNPALPRLVYHKLRLRFGLVCDHLHQ